MNEKLIQAHSALKAKNISGCKALLIEYFEYRRAGGDEPKNVMFGFDGDHIAMALNRSCELILNPSYE